MHLAVTLLISAAMLPITDSPPAFSPKKSSDTYNIKFALKTIDGRYFGGSATCKKRSDCHAEFGNGFKMSIIDYKDNYSISIYNISDDPSLQRCCSFITGKGTTSLDARHIKHTIRLYHHIRDELSYQPPVMYEDLFLITEHDD